MFVQRPGFVILTSSGGLYELFCKVCGTAIGGVGEMVRDRRMERDGRTVEERVAGFRRYQNYAELKMRFSDGSFHVTNGCRNCLNDKLTPGQLQELHHADMDLEATPSARALKTRKPIEVVAVRTDGGGIA